ncbi:MAG: hypothetical protein ACI4EH_10195 [Oliverpabstia sp.]
MKKHMLRTAIFIVIGYFLLWYVGAMFNFLPFLGGDFAVRAIGFTGFLLCLVIVTCTCWISYEIKRK